MRITDGLNGEACDDRLEKRNSSKKWIRETKQLKEMETHWKSFNCAFLSLREHKIKYNKNTIKEGVNYPSPKIKKKKKHMYKLIKKG